MIISLLILLGCPAPVATETGVPPTELDAVQPDGDDPSGPTPGTTTVSEDGTSG